MYFQLILLEMGWNYCIYILRGAVYHCSFYYIGLWSASKSGMSKGVAPAFLFTQTNLIAIMELVAVKADGSNFRQY